jgi:type I restriction enzyme R subunit
MVPPGSERGLPEQRARQKIDAAFAVSGGIVQDRDEMNVSAGRGVAVRELELSRGHGFADYLLFVDGKAAGVLEAKAEGFPLIGVEPQAKKYAEGLPVNLDRQRRGDDLHQPAHRPNPAQ